MSAVSVGIREICRFAYRLNHQRATAPISRNGNDFPSLAVPLRAPDTMSDTICDVPTTSGRCMRWKGHTGPHATPVEERALPLYASPSSGAPPNDEKRLAEDRIILQRLEDVEDDVSAVEVWIDPSGKTLHIPSDYLAAALGVLDAEQFREPLSGASSETPRCDYSGIKGTSPAHRDKAATKHLRGYHICEDCYNAIMELEAKEASYYRPAPVAARPIEGEPPDKR